jgi:hypothetical protein
LPERVVAIGVGGYGKKNGMWVLSGGDALDTL